MKEMYNETVTAANKIITYNDLYDIFNSMNEEITKLKKISENEERNNQRIEYQYQKWTVKDNISNYHMTINFYDDTEIKFDNYNNFITIFNNRLEEIKNIYVHYYISYSQREEKQKTSYHTNSISMFIYENKIDVNVSLDSNDEKTNHIYEMIKNKINSAPDKYDEIIKNKSSITFKVGIAIAFIPAIIISIFLLFIPTIRILFPFICFIVAFVLSSTTSSWKLDDLYKNIAPDKKYISYEKGYKDDIDRFTNTSEILIGKNAHNIENRKQIEEIYNKYKKYIPYEIVIIIILSLIAIFLK